MAEGPDDKDREKTSTGVKMPVLPKGPPGAPSPPAAPPPDPGPAVAGAAGVPAASSPPADLDEEGGTIRRVETVASARLQRIAPAGRSGVVSLSRPSYLVGRLQSADIRMFTATASREHARLSSRGGSWYLQPLKENSVVVNGVKVKEEVALTHKMQLQFGDDQLVFLDDTAADVGGEPAARAGGRGLLLVGLAAAAIIVAAVIWFATQG